MNVIETLSLGDRAANRGDYETAVDIYTRGLILDPFNDDLLRNRYLAHQNMLTKQKAISISPSYVNSSKVPYTVINKKTARKRKLSFSSNGGDGQSVISNIKLLTSSLGKAQSTDGTRVIKNMSESSSMLREVYSCIESRTKTAPQASDSSDGEDDSELEEEKNGETKLVSKYLNQPTIVNEIANFVMGAQIMKQNAHEEMKKKEEEDKVNSQIEMLINKGKIRNAKALASAPPLVDKDKTVVDSNLPVIGTISPRTAKKISLMPPPNDFEIFKVAEYENKFMKNSDNNQSSSYLSLYDTLNKAAKRKKQLLISQLPNINVDNSNSSINNPLSKSGVVKNAIRNARSESKQAASPTSKSGLFYHSSPKEKERKKSPSPPPILHKDIILEDSNNNISNNNNFHLMTSIEASKMLIIDSDNSHTVENNIINKEKRLIDDVKRWLPKELLFQANMAKYVHQVGASTILEVISRFINTMTYAALLKWKKAVIHKRNVEKMKCAIKIQRVVLKYRKEKERKLKLKLIQEQEEREKRRLIRLEMKKNHGAVQMQKLYRGYKSRKNTRKYIKENLAAIKIQNRYKMYKSKLILLIMKALHAKKVRASIDIQRIYRGFTARRRCKILNKIRKVERTQKSNLKKSQKWRKYFKLEGAALKIQRWYRAKLMVKYTRKKARAKKFMNALCIQHAYKCYRARKELAKLKLEKKNKNNKIVNAAVKLQTRWRIKISQRKLKALKEAVIKEINGRKVARAEAKKDKIIKLKPFVGLGPIEINATQISRTFYKAKRFFDPFLHKNEAIASVKIQRVYRGYRARKRMKKKLINMRLDNRVKVKNSRKENATIIQRIWRGKMARNRVKKMILNIAAVKIQSLFRGFRGRKKVEDLRKLNTMAIKIQKRYRMRLAKVMVQALKTNKKLKDSGIIPLQHLSKMWYGVKVVEFIREQRRIYAEIKLMGKSELDAAIMHLKDSLLLRSAFPKKNDKEYVTAGVRGILNLLSVNARGEAVGGMTGMKWAKLMKECPGLMDNKKLNSVRVDIIFSKYVGNDKKEIELEQFVAALIEVAGMKYPNVNELRRINRPPQAKLLTLLYEFILKKGFKMTESAREELNIWANEILNKAIVLVQSRFRGRKSRSLFEVIKDNDRKKKQEEKMKKASILIQSVCRRWKAKKFFIKLMQEVWIKYLEPVSREFYYYNPRTGTKSWYKPKLFGKHDCLEFTKLPDKTTEYIVKCVYCNDKTAIYVCNECEDPCCEVCFDQNHIRGTKATHTRSIIPLCSDCKYQAVTRLCNSCTAPVPKNQQHHIHVAAEKMGFCDTCFPNLHQRGAKLKHKEIPYVVFCIECESLAARWRCENCQDNFCTDCFANMHNKGNKALHIYKPLPYFSLQMKNRRENIVLAAEKAKKDAEALLIKQKKQKQKEFDAAVTIQKHWRGRIGRIEGKGVLKGERRKIRRKWKQRKVDDKIRDAFTYKVADMFGLATKLKSDTEVDLQLKSVPIWKRGTIPELHYKRLPGTVSVKSDSHFAYSTTDLTSRLERKVPIWIGSAARGFEFKVHPTLPFTSDRIPLEPKWALDPIEDAPIYLIPPSRSGWVDSVNKLKESSFVNTFKSIKANSTDAIALGVVKIASKTRSRGLNKLANKLQLNAKQYKYNTGSKFSQNEIENAWKEERDEVTAEISYVNHITEERTLTKPAAIIKKEILAQESEEQEKKESEEGEDAHSSAVLAMQESKDMATKKIEMMKKQRLGMKKR